MKKKILSLLASLIATTAIWAADFTVDGISYNITDAQKRIVEVTSKSPHYSGSITIPSSVTYSNVTFTVTSIGYQAFYACTSLTSVTIGNSVTRIGYEAFDRCSALTSITIPNSVTHIEDYAFDYCENLTSVHISDIAAWCQISFGGPYASPLYGAGHLGDGHLYLGDNEIKDLVISNSVDSIKNHAFRFCTGLTSVTISDSVKSIGEHAFGGCTNLTSITIPNSVTNIDNFAISYCISLTSLIIPNSVTNIGSGAFESCTSLTSVNIGNSVTSIGDEAFIGCTSITSIIVERATPPTLGDNAFKDVSHFIPLYVPDGSKSAYQNANGWNLFFDIREMTDCPFSLTVSSSNEAQGIAEIATFPSSIHPAVISATANKGYAFSHWSDGNKDNPRTITVTQDTTLIAYFNRTFLQVNILSDDTTLGYVMGGGIIDAPTTMKIGALCTAEGYRFSHWSDGSTTAGRTIDITSDTTLIAYFVEDAPTGCIEVSSNSTTLGTADIQIIATPVAGCSFMCWLDGNTDNPRTVTDSPGSYMAIFTGIPSAIERTIASNPQDPKFIINNQLLILRDGKTYNAQGGEVR